MKNENFLFGCGAFDVLCYVNATEESEKEKYSKRTKEWLDLITEHCLFTGGLMNQQREMSDRRKWINA